MDAAAWTVVATGVTLLIAIGVSFQSLRNGIERVRKESGAQNEKLRDRIEAQGKETGEQLAQLRERMAKLEGLLEGLREAITGKRAA